MENNKNVTLSHEVVDELKARMEQLKEQNNELKKRNKDLQEHLDDALKQLFSYTINQMEKQHNARLKPITSEKAKTILFTDAYEQLGYLLNNKLMNVTDKNRRFVYDNAEQYKWFIVKKNDEDSKDEQSELPLQEPEKKEPKENWSFIDKFHEVSLQDLPAYLKIFRYEEKLKVEEVNEIVSQGQWSSYERGEKQPRENVIKRLEEALNIKVNYSASVKTIRIHDFGNRLQELSDARGMTISQLSKAVGIQYQTIYNYIDGKFYPSAFSGTINKIADVLKVSICYLLTGTNEWE